MLRASIHRVTVKALLVGALSSYAISAEPVSVVARTGPPEIVENKAVPVFLHGRDEYEAATKYDGGLRPGKLPASAAEIGVRLGVVRTSQGPVTVAVFQHDGGNRVVVDANQNGDLDDDRILILENGGEGSRFFSEPFQLGNLPTRISAVVSPAGAVDRLFIHLNTVRYGQVALDGRSIRFALVGFLGRYDAPHSAVYFDLDGDGELHMSQASSERFAVREQLVTIDGSVYELEIDGNGDSLALTEMPGVQNRRADLALGAPAPDFAFVDVISGASRTLSGYEGNVVLLYGWGTWCRPCKKELPYLLKAYEVFGDKGFEIIGINKGDVKSDVLAYSDHYNMLYRMEAFPSTVLIDKNGRIANRGLRGEDLLEELTARLATRESTE